MPDDAGLPQGQSLRPDVGPGVVAQRNWPAPDVGQNQFNFTYGASAADKFWGLLSENKPSSDVRYADPDGVQRLAMGGLSSGEDGLPMAVGNFESRPVVLNRPFRSVAELGYVLRDQPWKQLDFFSPESGDAALLDVFCIHEPADSEAEPLVAGRVNLNSARPEVLAALLRGVDVVEGSPLDAAEAQALGEAVVDWTNEQVGNTSGPLRNRSELVGKFLQDTDYSGVMTDALGNVLSGANRAIPIRRQNVLRALADAGTTRTWVLMIDLIVQDGRFVRAAGNSDDFVVRGEKRFWVHVAMDRFTGRVISKAVEEVYE